jgi:ubiquinone/menaquinone biosynthesis C-methylase UbiE
VVRLIAIDLNPKGSKLSNEFDTDILGHYNQGFEQDRLMQGRGKFERLRMRELLTRHLPPAPAVVLDVGGGAGVHALWLAAQGYEVHLIDPVQLHVEQAMQASDEASEGKVASATVGDARQLEWTDASVDAVLLLGPLYHLIDRDDRLRTLSEARRVLRPGGIVCAVGISRFASLFNGLMFGLFEDPEFASVVEQDLRDGQHRNPSNNPNYFTTAFFHHPDELRAETQEAGLEIVELVSVQGPPDWMVPDFFEKWMDPTWRDRILAASRAVEKEPTLLGLGPHLMVIAQKA